MPRSRFLPGLCGACLLACTPRSEPEGIRTVEVERPSAESPIFVPPPKPAVRAADELAPVVATEPAPWSVVALERVRDELPWVRARHTLAGRLELPRSGHSEPMVMSPVVVVTAEGVYFAGQKVAAVEFGVVLDLGGPNRALVVPLQQPLAPAVASNDAEEARQPGPRLPGFVALLADAATPFGVLVYVMHTAGQAGATDFQIVVERGKGPGMRGTDVLQVATPRHVAGQSEAERLAAESVHKTEMIMELTPTEVRIGRHVPRERWRSAWIERVSLEGDRAAAMKRVTALARAIVAAEQWDPLDSPVVRVGADAYVPLELLVAALAAASGTDCDRLAPDAAGRGRCLFVERVVYGGSPAPPELAGR